jgi:hypothetical protein
MKFRRRRFKTAFLASLVHPLPLLEALKGLQERGDLEWFEYGKYNCTIKLTKYSGLDIIIKEASQPVAATKVNPKKINERTFRKTKS